MIKALGNRSLASKITFFVLGMMLLLTAGSLFAVAMSLRSQLDVSLELGLKQSAQALKAFLNHKQEILAASLRPTANAPLLKAALSSAELDTATLQGVAEEQRKMLNADLVVLLSADGAVRASNPEVRKLPGANALGSEGGQVALIDGKPYLVVSTAIEVANRRLGYIVGGVQLSSALLTQFKDETNAQVIVRVNGKLFGEAVTTVSAGGLSALSLQPGQTTDVQVGGVTTRVYEVELASEVSAVLARDEELSRFRQTLFWLVLIGLFTALLGAAVTAVVTRRLTQPLRQLTEIATRVVADGDFSQEIPVSSAGEIGQLTTAFSQMMQKFREVLGTLRGSAEQLGFAALELSSSADEQSQSVSRQASALQETQITAQEIKQTSVLASQKAEAVLQVAERADQISLEGEQAIESSVSGLTEIRAQVAEIAQKINELRERTRQIGGITQTVKDLADQSNMLALNAAIEAVRSGEHGKGFAVVAREIRSLADQSIQATNRVRDILDDISSAISTTVTITEKGAQRMESGLIQVKASGDNLRELSTIVKDNSGAARQIAAAVSQQNAGITQIFTAVTDLSRMMDDAVRRVESTKAAATSLKGVTERVSQVVKSYRI